MNTIINAFIYDLFINTYVLKSFYVSRPVLCSTLVERIKLIHMMSAIIANLEQQKMSKSNNSKLNSC